MCLTLGPCERPAGTYIEFGTPSQVERCIRISKDERRCTISIIVVDHRRRNSGGRGGTGAKGPSYAGKCVLSEGSQGF